MDLKSTQAAHHGPSGDTESVQFRATLRGLGSLKGIPVYVRATLRAFRTTCSFDMQRARERCVGQEGEGPAHAAAAAAAALTVPGAEAVAHPLHSCHLAVMPAFASTQYYLPETNSMFPGYLRVVRAEALQLPVCPKI
eukprot:1147310-Pelagomonas_calceolata.AAC.4